MRSGHDKIMTAVRMISLQKQQSPPECERRIDDDGFFTYSTAVHCAHAVFPASLAPFINPSLFPLPPLSSPHTHTHTHAPSHARTHARTHTRPTRASAHIHTYTRTNARAYTHAHRHSDLFSSKTNVGAGKRLYASPGPPSPSWRMTFN